MSTPTLTPTFGCQHIKTLLQTAHDPAIDGYTRLVQSLRKDGKLAESTYKRSQRATATCKTTYLCLQCPNVSPVSERHTPKHAFSVESRHACILCHDCNDFVYDPTFEEIRSGNSKKRKAAAFVEEGDKRLVSANTAATPCAATGLRGLYNMGQTCFMSVVLQSLIHNPFIRTWYLSEAHRSSDCEREACTSCALDDLFTDFYGAEKHEGYGAVHLLQACWKGGGGLAGYSQQDAHEFLGSILDKLHTANTEHDDEAAPAQRKGAEDCDCVIHQTFGGLLKSTVTCSNCNNTTTTLDPFTDLSLDIRQPTVSIKKKKLTLINGTTTVKEVLPMDLTECLTRFTATETLTADSYHCRKCNSSQGAKKAFSLSCLPPVIPIHLKRFSHSKTMATSSKVDTRIRFPFTLDLSPYTHPPPAPTQLKLKPKDELTNGHEADPSIIKDPEAPDSDPVYELSSVVVHKGKIDNGHYISYCKQGDEWFRFDDSMVVQVDEKELLAAEAYMLFYVVREFA